MIDLSTIPFEHLDKVVLVRPAENLEALQVADVSLLVLAERYGTVEINIQIRTELYVTY